MYKTKNGTVRCVIVSAKDKKAAGEMITKTRKTAFDIVEVKPVVVKQ